ncbi:MAG: hypothetical protein BAJALOKI2v1_630012 [Promethearchaeota archaeon]|nr:MAG: hypothetical protein BAJALOKI2v1_630012 [Candidatus Lokiarchaeota archaeon]
MMKKRMSEKTLEKEEKIELTNTQRTSIYSYAMDVRKDTLNEICPALLDVCLDAEGGELKNELGQVIFHLQKNERLNTKLGLQKLLDGALRVDPERTFRILDTGAPDLSQNIKKAL